MPSLTTPGFYDVPGLPYPKRPSVSEDPNFDLLGNRVATAGPPTGTMSGAPGAQVSMQDPSVIRLAPGRQTPFSRADAQALASLDPRALDEANRLAALPESQPATMTATVGGQRYEMTPRARVDRNALARLYSQAQERKAQERQDAVRGQEQAGKERLVSIPGQQATERAKIEAEAKTKLAEGERIAAAPERRAKVASMEADTAAATAKAARDAQTFSQQPTQAQTAADEEYNRIASSPFATTPEARAQMARLRPFTTAGKNLPSQALAGAEDVGAPDSATIMAQVADDPAVKRLLEQVTRASAGFFPNAANRTAANALATRLIRERLQRAGFDSSLIDQATQSIISNRG